MGKLQLPSVTLVCIDCLDANRAIKILEHCKTKADFGSVKLLTSIPVEYDHVRIMPLNSLIAYSIFVLTRLHEYIDTTHLLIVQRDGWILNPESFDPAWLELDYVAPLFIQYDRCGSGGFSLRSKKMMQDISETIPFWDGSEKEAQRIQKLLNYYEDGIVSFTKFIKPYKIASLDQAANFGHGGNRNPKYFVKTPFGFHRTFANINFTTGEIDYSDLSKDIHVTYDNEIDLL